MGHNTLGSEHYRELHIEASRSVVGTRFMLQLRVHGVGPDKIDDFGRIRTKVYIKLALTSERNKWEECFLIKEINNEDVFLETKEGKTKKYSLEAILFRFDDFTLEVISKKDFDASLLPVT